MGALYKNVRRRSGGVRCDPAVFHPKGSDDFMPTIRIIDAAEGAVSGEFFSIGVNDLDAFVANLRQAGAEAQARADDLKAATPEARALLVQQAEGRA